MKVISPLDGGGQEVILTLIQGGCNFILRPTLLILETPPLLIIIAQSLTDNYFFRIILSDTLNMNCVWHASNKSIRRQSQRITHR